VKLVDTLDLGSGASQRGGSSPSTRTHFGVQRSGLDVLSSDNVEPGLTTILPEFCSLLTLVFNDELLMMNSI
jgi:hypothetical protein